MKGIIGVTLGILFLNCIQWTAAKQPDKECLVTSDLLLNCEKQMKFNISFFMTPDDPLIIQASFMGRKKNQDNDLLLLKTNNGILQRKRDGEADPLDISLKNNIPVGWNTIFINVFDTAVDIGKFYTLTPLEYRISEISISGKWLTNCTKGTPMWNIDQSKEVSIPLNGLSSIGMKLYSAQPFQPDITINNLAITLSYQDELVFRKTNTPLPPQWYSLHVNTDNEMISIFNILENEQHKLIMKANTKEGLENVKVRALNGEFILIFDPFYQTNYKENDTDLHYGTTQSTRINSEPDNSSFPSKEIIEAPSCTLWKVTTGLSLGIGAIFLFVSFWLYRTRFTTQKTKVYGIEEGEANKPLLEKDPVKNRIRTEHTEPHGQGNLQVNPHHTEVCKIKLQSYKKGITKILGHPDNNKPTKVIIVVGESESGKSSFINAMTNFIYGISYDDPFRFKLVCDTGNSNPYIPANTTEFMAYYIPYMFGIKHSCNYIFIDTPGFGNSNVKGLNEDKEWYENFYEFLKNNPDICEVDGICFMRKATDTRLTIKQKYIIDSLFSKFGKDIKKNIYAVVSYSDGSESHVTEVLQKSGLDYSLALHFNSKGIYNEEGTSSDSEDVQEFIKKCWEMNMTNLDNFFNRLKNTTAVNLSLTTVVLEENKDISKIRDEILELMANENYATDQEKQEIQSRIEQNQELLMMKLDEAQKLSGRLESIPCKTNPLVANEYIDMLIANEENEDTVSELQKLKERNTSFNKLLKEKKTSKRLSSSVLGEKTKKTK